ncbi:MAG: hypothetical protein R2697_04510 [Ilumatobacteraceae bacterium]
MIRSPTRSPCTNQRGVRHSEHGDPIDPLTVLQLMIAGYIRYVIANDQGVPIQWGRKLTLARRRSVRRGEGDVSFRCTHPLLTAPKRTHTDHTLDYAKGGTTDPANGNPRASTPQPGQEPRYYTVHRDALGEWHTYRPDGTEIG